MLLTGCSTPNARGSEALYQFEPWPTTESLQMQSDVAKYITRGHTSYLSCVAVVDALKPKGVEND